MSRRIKALAGLLVLAGCGYQAPQVVPQDTRAGALRPDSMRVTSNRSLMIDTRRWVLPSLIDRYSRCKSVKLLVSLSWSNSR